MQTDDSKYDLVLLNSGGFDSTVLFYDLMNQGKRVLSLFFRYGQNNESEEMSKVIEMCNKFKQEYKVLVLPRFDWSKTTIDKHTDAPSCEALEYVEMRNLIFLSYAASIAESLGVHEIYMAVLSSELGFKDTQPEFLDVFEEIVKNIGIKIITPFIDLTKDGVGHIARIYNIAENEFFSCHYPTSGQSCGKCSKCKEINYIYDNIIPINTHFKEWVRNNFIFSDKFSDLYLAQPLTELRLLINNDCNCVCNHCFYGFREMKRPELTYAEKLDIVKQAINLGATNIHISGKEPLIDNLVFSYAKDIKSFVPHVGIDVVTNGLTLEKYTGMLNQSALSRICISIDGVENAGVRGDNDYVANLIKSASGINKKITIFIVIHKGNYKNMLKTIQFCFDNGFDDIYISALKPLGNGKNMWQDLLTIEEIDFVYNELLTVESGMVTFAIDKAYTKELSLGYSVTDFLSSMVVFGNCLRATPHLIVTGEFYCVSFSEVITLTPDGYVLGCASEVASSDYDTLCSAGNVRDNDLKILLERGRRLALQRLPEYQSFKSCYHRKI